MPDVLASSQAWLTSRLKSHAAKDITYARGAAAVALRATVGRSVHEIDAADDGLLTRVEVRDFVFPAADLVLAGSDTIPAVPAPGDRITEGGSVFEVMSPGPGIQHWAWSDPHRTRYRVHTNEIGTA